MKSVRFRANSGVLIVVTIWLAAMSWATPQQNNSSATPASPTVVPRLVSFSGVVKDPKGNPVTGAVDLTFSLYTFEEGGSPLWAETQKVQLDEQGHYTVLLGATNPEGLPLDLFTSGQAQWLGVQPELPGAPEQPRVLLVGMPYALKAVDADTLGGLPASAFAMAPAAAAGTNSALPSPAQAQAVTSPGAAVPQLSSITGSGTANTLAMFTGSSTIGNSLITQSGGAAVFGEALQVPALGTATSSTAFNSQPFDSLASAYNSSTHAAVEQHFRWQSEAVGNNTSSPSGKFNLLFASGTGSPAETGLSISNKGIFTFTAGQTFPGTGAGSVTSVGSGAGLTGGPITKTGSLSIANAGVTNTMLQHSSLTVTAGTGLIGGGIISLGGAATLSLATASCPAGSATVALPLSCASFATLGANSFSGNQAVTGNLSATGEVSAGKAPTGNVASGNVEVDAAAVNSGGYGPGLTFGGGGETIASNRTGSTNQYGLDFFTGYTSRMSITNTGRVGIGNQGPSFSWLEVDAGNNSGLEGARLAGGSDSSGSGTGVSNAGVVAFGGDDTSVSGGASGYGAYLYGGSSTNGYGGSGLLVYGGTGAQGDGDGGDFYAGEPYGDGVWAYGGLDAGYFAGDVEITGNLYVLGSSKNFKIDHPLDPANKYLYHAAIESSEVLNLYRGNVTLDANGEAIVTLPDWFEAINKDLSYQLTPIGGSAPGLYVAAEVSNNQFKVAGGRPGLKVSWQITGVRNDAEERANAYQAEVDKPARERGYYIHPELYGAPKERQIEWARHPEMMKRIKEHREKRASLAQAKKP
jgi:hypothetical protein